MTASYGACKSLFFLGLLFWLPTFLWAQEFHVVGRSPLAIKGRVTMIIYDGDSSFRSLPSATKGAEFSFSGTVRQPVLAELRHAQWPQPLFFYLENSEITITPNLQNPAASPVQGSRTNSLYRIALESCQGDHPKENLLQWVSQNPSSPFAPFILYENCLEDYDLFNKHFNLLEGEALHTYHAHLLRRRLKALQCVTVGQKMPDVLLPDTLGKTLHLDSLRSDSSFTVIAIGARWCEQCLRTMNQLKKMAPTQGFVPIMLFIDSDKRGWDAPYLQQLAVDRIPYLILLDKEGTIVGRDIRIWELERVIKEGSQRCPPQKKS